MAHVELRPRDDGRLGGWQFIVNGDDIADSVKDVHITFDEHTLRPLVTFTVMADSLTADLPDAELDVKR